VLRANAIGDFIFALPALEALRAAYPQAEIVYLGKRWHHALLSGRPGPVDRVVVVPPSPGVNTDPPRTASSEELTQFFSTMAEERFDLALQLHGGGGNSNPFVQRLQARLTAGSRAPDAPPLDRWVPYRYWQPEMARLLEVVGLVGAPPVAIEPRLAVLERDRVEAADALPPSDKPLVLLHPGATGVDRRWPPEKFAAVGDALAGAGAEIAVIGVAEDRPLVAAVIGGMRQAAVDLCGRVSLGGLVGLFARCSLVVGNDSGPIHLAHAVGARTVGIYWCGNLFTAGPLTRARHWPIVSWRLACPICGRNTIEAPCEHRVSFVADVPVEEVLAACRAQVGWQGATGV
jgi:ADP-heptose:LPS heptosyltransferase